MDFQDLVKFALICFDFLAWPLFALGYPLHASIQAIETNSNTDTKKLVTYWIIFSLISLFEHAFMGILQWLPFWPYMKLMIVGWMMIPRFDGAFYIYNNFVHPCLYMDSPTIINMFKKLHEFYLNNFLAEAADEHVEADRPVEALENLIANETKGTEPSILQEDTNPVRVAENIDVAPVKQIPATEPVANQTVNDTVTHPGINGEPGFDLPDKISDKQVQKEWTCALCQVKVPCEKTLNSHLRGRKHRNLCKMLTMAKNQPGKGKVGSDSAVKEPWKDGWSSNIQGSQKNQKLPEGRVSAAASVAPKNTGIPNNNASTCYKEVNPETEMSKRYPPIEESKKSVLATNVVGNQVKSSEIVQGQQQVGKENGETKIPQFWCTVCNVTCTRLEDLNCHLWGRKHLAQIQKLSEGQTSASPSLAPKNTDIPYNNASACYRPVNPKTGTSKCYLPTEESKKPVLATNMSGNQVQSSENVQGHQQVGKEHGETKIPQFRCNICNVTCSRSEDLNRHLFGRKHLAQIQKLSEGQVSASSSVAPKNSDIPNNNASACYLPTEESKKPVLTTNMSGNQVQSSENVQGQQQVRKEHGETRIPQFRCTICDVTCSSLEDLNCHLWGRKHLAQIQNLNNL